MVGIPANFSAYTYEILWKSATIKAEVFDPTVTSSSPAITQRFNDIAQYISDAEKLLVAVAAFATVGLGGLWVAFRKVYSQLRGVEAQVSPIGHEITDRVDDTLSSRVDIIAATLDSEKLARDRQHDDNSGRLDRIESHMDQLQEDMGGMRKVLDRILAKLANI
jgi:hypothetical protein